MSQWLWLRNPSALFQNPESLLPNPKRQDQIYDKITKIRDVYQLRIAVWKYWNIGTKSEINTKQCGPIYQQLVNIVIVGKFPSKSRVVGKKKSGFLGPKSWSSKTLHRFFTRNMRQSSLVWLNHCLTLQRQTPKNALIGSEIFQCSFLYLF